MRLGQITRHFAKVVLCMAVGCLCWGVTTASTNGQSVDSFEALRQGLGDSIKAATIANKKTIRYCPDNTCDEFVASNSTSSQHLADFAYLYLFFFSDYVLLKEWRESSEAKQAAERILSESSARVCPETVDAIKARCVLKKILKKNGVRIYAVRYDESTLIRQRTVLP